MLSGKRFTLCSGAALVLLAGCSGGGSMSSSALPQASQVQASRSAASSTRLVNTDTGRVGLPSTFHAPVSVPQQSWLSPEGIADASGTIFVDDYGNNAVYEYSATKPGAPLVTITTGISSPLGNCVDSAGALYVTNIGSSAVTVYPKGATSPSKTLTTGLASPIGCTVGSDGTLYVSEYSTGAVVEFAKGATKPARTITIANPEGVAVDAKNNLYVSNNSTGSGTISEYKPKATTGKDLGITVQFAGDVKVDKLGDILLEDQIAETVNFYKAGKTTAYGSITAPSGTDTYKLALNSTGKSLYIGTFAADVPIYQAVPSGKLVGTITQSLSAVGGVALSPAYVP